MHASDYPYAEVLEEYFKHHPVLTRADFQDIYPCKIREARSILRELCAKHVLANIGSCTHPKYILKR